jgi:hypothetical protein
VFYTAPGWIYVAVNRVFLYYFRSLAPLHGHARNVGESPVGFGDGGGHEKYCALDAGRAAKCYVVNDGQYSIGALKNSGRSWGVVSLSLAIERRKLL